MPDYLPLPKPPSMFRTFDTARSQADLDNPLIDINDPDYLKGGHPENYEVIPPKKVFELQYPDGSGRTFDVEADSPEQAVQAFNQDIIPEIMAADMKNMSLTDWVKMGFAAGARILGGATETTMGEVGQQQIAEHPYLNLVGPFIPSMVRGVGGAIGRALPPTIHALSDVASNAAVMGTAGMIEEGIRSGGDPISIARGGMYGAGGGATVGTIMKGAQKLFPMPEERIRANVPPPPLRGSSLPSARESVPPPPLRGSSRDFFGHDVELPAKPKVAPPKLGVARPAGGGEALPTKPKVSPPPLGRAREVEGTAGPTEGYAPRGAYTQYPGEPAPTSYPQGRAGGAGPKASTPAPKRQIKSGATALEPTTKDQLKDTLKKVVELKKKGTK